MSFRLQGPSLLLNSYDFTNEFGGCGMFMDTTWNCPRYTTAKHVVGWIGMAAAKAPDRKLSNVVLNFHGKPGQVYVGEAKAEKYGGIGSGIYAPGVYNLIDNDNAGAFWALRDYRIGTLWFHSCDLAGNAQGRTLCRQIALAAHCRVVAAVETQDEWWAPLNVVFMPRGCIDDFEGKVLMWDPQGHCGEFDPNGGNWN